MVNQFSPNTQKIYLTTSQNQLTKNQLTKHETQDATPVDEVVTVPEENQHKKVVSTSLQCWRQ
jgi:hypothetical protein